MAELSYSDVLARYDRAKAFGETRSLPDYSKYLNDTFGTDAYSAGLRDGPWTRMSTRLDQAIEGSPIGDVGAELGGAVGSAFGNEEAGRKVGAGLPRALAQSAPAYALGPETGIPATAAALGAMGLLFGGQTYADTGSAKRAIVSGVAAAAMPGLGKVGGNIGARLFGGSKLVGELGGRAFNEVLPETAADASKVNLGRFFGSQAVQASTQIGSTLAQDRLTGGHMSLTDAATSPEFLLGQLPFTVFDAVHMASAHGPTAEEVRPGLVQPGLRKPIEPFVPRTLPNEEDAAQTSAFLEKASAIGSDPNATPQAKSDALGELIQSVLNPETVLAKKEAVAPVAQEDANLPVNVWGRVSKVDDGRYRVLVDKNDGMPRVQDLAGQTVFVNGAEPTFDPETGRMQFSVKPEQINLKTNFKLSDTDFPGPTSQVPDVRNPDLPVQPPSEPLSPEDINRQADELQARAQQLRLTTAEVQAMPELGLGPDEATSITTNPDPVVVQHTKETVAKFEQAQAATETARTATISAPDKSTEIPSLFVDPVAAKPKLQTAVESGATPTQAVGEGILRDQTPVVDAGLTEQKVQKVKASKLAKIEYAKQVEAGQQLIKAYTDAAATYTDPDHPFYRAGKVINKALVAEDIADPKYTDRVAATVFKWSSGKYKNQSIETLQRALGKTESQASTKYYHPASPVSYLVDGKRVSGSTEFLSKYIADNGLDKDGWGIMKNEKGRATYIGKRREGTVSLDQSVGEGTTTMGDVIQGSIVDVPTSERPRVSKNDSVAIASKLYEDPKDFAEDIRNPSSSPGDEHVADVKEQLGQFVEAMKLKNEDELGQNTGAFLEELNSRLKAKGLGEIGDHDTLREVLLNVGYWIDNYTQTYRNIGLESVVLGDAALGSVMGVDKDVQSIARYIGSQKASMGFVADFMQALHDSGILPKDVQIQLPGHPDHDPNGFWVTDNMGLIPSRLNIPHYPSKETMGDYVHNLAHELVHLSEQGLELRDDPAAMQYKTDRTRVLKSMRESSAVPKSVRQLLQRSLRDGDMAILRGADYKEINAVRDRWFKALKKDGNLQYWSYLYGMQNEKEMMATLFSDPRMVDIASRTQSKFEQFLESPLTFLSKVFNRLIGDRPENETALSTLLRSYDNYLTGGILRKTYNGANFIRDSLVAQGVRPDALASRMQSVDRTYARGTLEGSITAFKREQENGLSPAMQSKGEVHPDVEAALKTGQPGDAFDSTMNLLADQLPVHQDLLRRMQQDVEVSGNLLDQIKAGKVPGSIPPTLETNLSLSRAKLNAMSRAMDKQALALARFNKLDQLNPEGWERAVGEGLTAPRLRNVEPPDEVPDAAEYRKLVALERLSGKSTVNPIAKWLMLTPHLKEIYPSTKPIISGVQSEMGLAHHRMTMLNGAWVWDSAVGNVSKEVQKSNLRVSANPRLSEAASDIFRVQNNEGNMQLVDTKHPLVRDVLRKFNAEDQKAIMQVVQSQAARHQAWTNIVLPQAMGNINVDNTGVLIAGREHGILPEQARQISHDLYQGLSALVDPQQTAVGMELLKQVSTQLSPDTYFAAIQHAQQMSKSTVDWINKVRSNPGWTSEQRYGTDKLIMMRGKDKATMSGDRETLQRQQAKLQAEGYEVLDYIKGGDVKVPNLGMSEDFLNSLDQLDAQNEQVVAQLLKDQPELAAQILPRIQRASDVRVAIAAGTPMPSVSRKFSTGREFINMIDNSNQFYVKMNNWLRQKGTRSRTSLDMMHPEIAGNTELTNLMNQHVQNFLTPDNPTARKIVEATYFYKLGFDLGNSLLEATQNLTTGMSTLISETGSIGDAFGLWGSAVKAITQHATSKSWGSLEHNKLMERAAEYGQQGIASWSDVVDPDSNTVFDSNAGTAANTVSTIKNGARKFTSLFTRFNDRIALISAFDLARSRGMNFDQAYDFAVDVKQRGLFTGGKAQRPIEMWGIKTKPVPQLIGALQTYSLGWFSQLAENYTKGFGKAPAGLTETQRLGAKKAFLYSLASQAALAGVLGLPGVGQGLALLNQSTGVDVKGWMRQNLAKLFDEDQTYGGVMTGLAMRGIGSAGLPFDPSSRASVSIPFIGVDAYKGFSVENLGGAATSTVGDFMTGLLGMLHGDVTAGEKMLPNVLKRPMQLLQGEGDIRDRRGGLQVELSPAERFMMATGITPTRVQTQRDIAEGVKKANLAAQQEKDSFVDGVAKQIRQGNVSGAHQQLTQYLQDHPEVNAKSLVSQVGARVVAQKFPYDPVREALTGTDLSGFATGAPSQEAERQATQQGVQRSLGMVPSLSAASMFRSSVIDRIRNQNPLMGRREARQQPGVNTPRLPSPYSWLSSGETPAVFQ